MNKSLATLIAFSTMFFQKGYCVVESIDPELRQALKVSSGEPSIFTVAFGLIFVVCLIYITGLIYTKLNIVGSSAVKVQLKNHDMNKIVVLSTTQIGQNKNLHVVEVDGKRLIIGSSPESINLIKELDKEEDLKTTIIDRAEKVEEPVKYEAEVVFEEFDIHKKYLNN